MAALLARRVAVNLAQTWKVSLLAVVAIALSGVGSGLSAARRAARIDARTPALEAALQAMSFTLEGKITQHTAGKLTVSTEENIIFHVHYGEKTEIKRQDGSQGSEKDLRVGLRIKVAGDLAESGEVEAQRIEIEPESPPPQR
jgi:hypothetical protein